MIDMVSREKTGSLVAYFDTTLSMIEHGHISYEQGTNILTSLEPEITNKKEVYSYLQYYNSYKLDYWYNFLFSKNEEAVDYLKEMTHKRYANTEILEKIINRFLKMPKKVRKDFYETNFVDFDYSEKSNVDYVKMCDQPFVRAETSKVFHNLPTLYLLTAKTNTKMNIVEDIIYDIKNVLKLNDSQFLDIYGHGLIHTLENSYIYKNWNYLEIPKRKDFKEAFTTKLILRGTLRHDEFMNLVEKNYLPYDVKFPRDGNYLMNSVIKSNLNKPVDYLKSTPFVESEFIERMQKSKDFITAILKKYDLYFFNKNILKESLTTMNSNFDSRFRHSSDQVQKTKLDGEILKYQFELNDIFNKVEKTENKKLKI